MRRAFATFLVLWIVALAGVLVAQIQSASYRQAAEGREQMARVRATWAARAGVEATIARLAYNTENPDQSDAFRVVEDMEEVATGAVGEADWVIFHEQDEEVLPGPADAHAKNNVSLLTAEAFMAMPYMTEDVADSILDWVDEDDDVRPYGAEVSYYQRADFPYEPRNAPMRTITELELVAGTDPEIVREEDWDLDAQLDPDERDGRLSWPEDNGDDVLEAGWSERLTAASIDGASLAASGDELIDLTVAGENDLTARLGIESGQAEAILAHAQAGGAMEDFLRTSLAQLAQAAGVESRTQIADLDDEQLALLLGETSIGVVANAPGKLNVNTCTDEALEYIPGIQPAVLDALLYDRADRQSGYTSLVDLLEIDGISRSTLADLYPYVTVRSNVYVVASRGRDRATGVEVQIVATIDRSTLPVVIRELTIR